MWDSCRALDCLHCKCDGRRKILTIRQLAARGHFPLKSFVAMNPDDICRHLPEFKWSITISPTSWRVDSKGSWIHRQIIDTDCTGAGQECLGRWVALQCCMVLNLLSPETIILLTANWHSAYYRTSIVGLSPGPWALQEYRRSRSAPDIRGCLGAGTKICEYSPTIGEFLHWTTQFASTQTNDGNMGII
jgi:hypothetical protein